MSTAGGKSPFIILEDADIDLAAKVAHGAIMFNSGQVLSRLTVYQYYQGALFYVTI